MSDSTRIEMDFPVVVVNHYGHLQLDNLKDVQDFISAGFEKGSVITLHIVAEDSGAKRPFCPFVSETSYGKSTCNFVLRPDGSCWREDEHSKERTKQPELAQAEESE